MATILYSYVGELAKFEDSNLVNTPDGMRYCRPLLIDTLKQRGHKIIAVQKRLEEHPYEGVEYSECLPDGADLMFCEWRWKTYKNDTHDLVRQTELLNHYHGNIPVILYDAAYQITAEDELLWPKAIIADPGISPKHLTRKRERLFFWSDFKRLLPTKDPTNLMNYGYIGNDYDRPEVFTKFYKNPSKRLREAGTQTVVYGNWIDKSIARPDPELLIRNMPCVMFGGRHSFKQSMIFLNQFIATTHLMKPDYDKHGNITVRFTDALAVGTPGLVPSSFLDHKILGREWVVSSYVDVIRKVLKLKKMTLEQREEVLVSQQESLLKKYNLRVEETVNFIESFIK